MKFGTAAIALTAGVCLFFLTISTAHAENWVEAVPDKFVDVDSIYKGAKGLVYHKTKTKVFGGTDRETWVVGKNAYDCQKKLFFYDMSYDESEEEWSDGMSVNPNSIGNKLMEFVCSRAH